MAQSAINEVMNTGWRDRLRAAVKASGKSPRAISLEAGRAHGYVHSLVKPGADLDPTITSLNSVCQVIGVSLAEILYGTALTTEGEELISLLANADPTVVAGVLQILRERKAP